MEMHEQLIRPQIGHYNTPDIPPNSAPSVSVPCKRFRSTLLSLDEEAPYFDKYHPAPFLFAQDQSIE